jgi:glycosyltransferase involved in cell wall biosynthesis
LKQERSSRQQQVHVIHLPVNQGVGGAVIAGFEKPLFGCAVIVKMDGDGQMDPAICACSLSLW